MNTIFIVAIIAVVVMAVLGYLIGNRGKSGFLENIARLEGSIADLTDKIRGQ